ncbi:MAG: hypothetical protein IJ664_05290 [Clostridia bacterium]|nr:hypothetical protein [Clostridia bacterium]
MKKLLFILLISLLICPAFAEEAWFEEQAAQLLPPGVEARVDKEACALALPEGRQALSLRWTAEGNLRFGRYDQIVRTALIDAETGEEIALTEIFPDLDALQEFLDAYVEENVLEGLNTYLDASDLLPVPLDAVSFDGQGVTFHYPSDRFKYFSGHAGAVQLMWYELRELTAISETGAPLPLEPGGSIGELLEKYGSLTEPDLVTGGELYEFEAPALRGVQAIADDAGTVTAVRYARFEWRGITPGMSREEVEALLAGADVTVNLDADTATYLRVQPGQRAGYSDTQLYYDEEGTLYLLERVLEKE